MQQSNAAAAAAALYDHQAGGDAGDVVMARWLQSAGLQHLASPLTSADQRMLPNLLMQGYGPQTIEEKQKVYKLLRNLNFNGESGSEPYTPTSQSFGGNGPMDGFFSPELRGEFGAGLLDLHAMDDTELLSDHVGSEPFEPSPFMAPREFDDDLDPVPIRQQRGQLDNNIRSSTNEKEIVAKESNVAKIKVVVRKRPLNKKEIARKEDDIVKVHDSSYLTVHEPKLKVDLTAYVEKHEFCFDAVLDENVNNDEVYRATVQPIIPTIFQRTKATCFAYGQTGSGKTFTMQPLPLRAVEDIVHLLHQPLYRSQKFHLWLSYFEIYGGKLFDLLSDRRKLCMREDGRQQVCIVGLQEFEVSDVQIVKEFIEKGNAARSTGSTGANEESSRSHAILQLAIKKHKEVNESKRHNDGNESKGGKVIGKISFIDLAGSERGADTTDNDRQTRIEGAEINKSLLALKECIRALDNDQIHIPFRGSKLTEVLRDSFVGNSRTVMISCISPNAGSCEHTLNTLRYADRVKSLSKNGNSRKDQTAVPSSKESSTAASALPISTESEDLYEQNQEVKMMETSRSYAESTSNTSSFEVDRHSTSVMLNSVSNGREESGAMSSSLERDRVDMRSSYNGTSSHKLYSLSQVVFNTQDEDKVPKVSPPRRKISRDEKLEKLNWPKKTSGHELLTTNSNNREESGAMSTSLERDRVDMRSSYNGTSSHKLYSSSQVSFNTQDDEKVPKVSPPRRKIARDEKLEKLNWPKKTSGHELPTTNNKQQQQQQQIQDSRLNNAALRQYEQVPPQDGDIDAILEEEEALIAAHRKEIETTMDIVREEMNLLAEVDQPGSLIDNYVTQLNFVLSRKAAGLVSLQARLARFQHRLKEQEILSRKKVPR